MVEDVRDSGLNKNQFCLHFKGLLLGRRETDIS